MARTIDVRGKPCPEPVIRTRSALSSSPDSPLKVLVDNTESSENVRRAAEGLGWNVEILKEDSDFKLTITPGEKPAIAKQPNTSSGTSGLSTVFVPGVEFGAGDPKLGDVLMRAALKTLKDLDPRPRKIVFMNDGVKWCCEGSQALDAIRDLEESGAEVLACGTCLDFFGLKEELSVGRVSNMFEILSSLQEAKPLLRL